MVYCPEKGELTRVLQENQIPFEIHAFMNWGYSYRSVKYWAFRLYWRRYMKMKFPAIVEHARRFKPDIIHSNSSVVSLGWQLAEILNCRHVWHIREFGYADYKIRFLLGDAFFIKKLQAADHLIFISEAIRDHFVARLGGVPQSKIYNGVFDASKAVPEPGPGRHFLILGMLHPSKGQLDALKAVRLLKPDFPNISLLIAGTGWKSYEAQLKTFINQHDLGQNVQLAGYVARPDDLISNAHALLVCSRNEAMGRVTAEAMAKAIPVIGYNAAATRELIHYSGGGLLYDSIEQLAAHMRQVLTGSQLRADLGKRGHNFALENFTEQQYASKVQEVYITVLGK